MRDELKEYPLPYLKTDNKLNQSKKKRNIY